MVNSNWWFRDLLQASDEHASEIISRWQRTIEHLRNRTPKASASKERVKTSDIDAQTDKIDIENFENDLKLAAKMSQNLESGGRKKTFQLTAEQMEELDEQKSKFRQKIEEQDIRIQEVRT